MQVVSSIDSTSGRQSGALKQPQTIPPAPLLRPAFIPAMQFQTFIARFAPGDELVQSDGDGTTMLMINARCSDMALMHLQLRYGAELDRADNLGRTALTWAAMIGTAESVRYLLNAGACPQHRGQFGMTALHWAAWSGKPEKVELFLKYGLDIDSLAVDGVTALGLAAFCGELAVVKFLLSRRASLAPNQMGDSALMHAALRGHTHVVKCLLAFGADPAHVNAAGDNALDCAQREKRKGVIALLRLHGVKPARQ